MKKFTVLLLAMCMVVCFATVSMAAFLSEVKTTSEAITAASGACEKIGSMSFAFDEGTILQDGDWWYADLPMGVTICRSIDFAILGAAAAIVPGAGGFPVATLAHGGGDDGGSTTNGFYTITDAVAGDLNAGSVTVAGTQMWFRVSATSGASRLLVQIFDSDAADYRLAACSDGTSTFTVDPGTVFTIKILDSDYHAAGPWGYNDTDSPRDGIYGNDVAADVLGVTNAYDNTVCVKSYGYDSSTVNVSINSGGESGANFLTFNPSNPQVAHLISAAAISLEMCKADEYGYVSLVAGQTATCLFDYENMAVLDGYCADVGDASFTGSVVTGNKLLIQNNSGTFFDAGDNFKLILRISGNGAYWGGATPAVREYPAGTTTQCGADAFGAGVENNMPAGAWGITTETGTGAGAVATGAGCGTIAAASRYTSLTSAAFTAIDDCYLIEVNAPNIVFDPARFNDGDQVTVTVELWRLPCGLIFSGSRTVAEFVDTCPAAAATTTLLFPYSTPLDGSTGWWFGMSFCNPNVPAAVAGTALITVYEDDGDIGTYTSDEIAVGGMVTYGGAELLSNLTADAANTGTLGDARCHIIVNCNFLGAGGFGMMGNGSDSTGYAAYGNSAIWGY